MNIVFLANLKQTANEVINYHRIQDFHNGQISLKNLIAKINTLITDTDIAPITDFITAMANTLQDIMTAQQNLDYILLADIIELNFLPDIDLLLNEYMAAYTPYEAFDFEDANFSNKKAFPFKSLLQNVPIPSKDFDLEYTSLGFPTIKYKGNTEFYYHSNKDPMEEALKLAKQYVKPDCFEYVILGLGLGYLPYALSTIDLRYKITIVETNLEVLATAFKHIDLGPLLRRVGLNIVHCSETDIAKYIDNPDATFIVHHPSLLALKNPEVKQLIHNYFIQQNSVLAQLKHINYNYYMNMRLNDKNIDSIKNMFVGKNVIYAGGGPSLADNLKDIKNMLTDKTTILLCASTVYRSLLENDISPNYVIIIDCKPGMVAHIRDCISDASLIYISTASFTATNCFSNPRYIALQMGYEAAEQLAKEQSYTLFESGGSVSTFVIDMAIRYNFASLTCFGLDLAYTNNQSHAFNGRSTEGNSLFTVRSVSGGTVKTANNLNLYRKWIEQRISSCKDTKFINISNGAYINGMENRCRY